MVKSAFSAVLPAYKAFIYDCVMGRSIVSISLQNYVIYKVPFTEENIQQWVVVQPLLRWLRVTMTCVPFTLII